jgi:hypothetical protein
MNTTPVVGGTGKTGWLGDGVQRALGRLPRDFADYARAAAATGIWNR